MNQLIIATACVMLGGLEQHFIPLLTDTPYIQEVDSGFDSSRDLFIIDGNTASLYENFGDESTISIRLPENTSAVDFSDINDDGRRDILVIAGEKLLYFDPADQTDENFKVLFESESLYAFYTGSPFPQILCAQKDEEILFLLPGKDKLMIKNKEGKLTEHYATGPDAPKHVFIGETFKSSSRIVDNSKEFPSLEIRIHETLMIKPSIPADWLKTALPLPEKRSATDSQLLDAANRKPVQRPWFNLEKGDAGTKRILYAVETGNEMKTITVVRDMKKPKDSPQHLSPERYYPGLIIQPEHDAPDFNNDGYADLLTWHTPIPAPTLSVFTRIAGKGTWPFTLLIYYFNPDKGNFNAIADTAVKLKIPIEYILQSGLELPLIHLITDDMNGDGTSDLAFYLEDSEFRIYFSGESGFSKTPDAFIKPDTLIEETLMHTRINEAGDYAIVFKLKDKLQVVQLKN